MRNTPDNQSPPGLQTTSSQSEGARQRSTVVSAASPQSDYHNRNLTRFSWFPDHTPPVNDEYSQRVVMRPAEVSWRATKLADLEIRILEHIPTIRLTAQLRLKTGARPQPITFNQGAEIFIHRGELEMPQGIFPAGLYLRLPAGCDETADQLILRTIETSNVVTPASEDGLLIYLAAGQIAETDTEQRRINTNDDSRWLPGPVDGTEVLPLHGHGSGNAMLVRWHKKGAFRPRLDPFGEEVLVLKGKLYDSHGSYTAGTWIRNPVPAWQTWAGVEDTVIYYKNGHFTDTGLSTDAC
ncbi:MAG: cupin domain-containing protein [Granulosicoccus sp.]